MAMIGFLMAVSCWRHRPQFIVIMRSFLKLLKLRKLTDLLIGVHRVFPTSRH